jgi:DNA/RNA-binding domain of Phe-tRNA-synthetase-like protein
MRFKVAKDVFQALPTACFGVVVAKNLVVRGDYPDIDARLQESVAAVARDFHEVSIKEAPQIQPYREAFLTLGMNPNKFQSSIEAMVTRIAKGKGFPAIHPLVDLANSVSLRYLVPLGAHDLDRAHGDIEVRFAQGGERFLPFGESAEEILEPGELIYTVGQNVRTRRWIWRQSEQGKITPSSRNIFFPIDGFNGINDQQVRQARDLLAELLREMFAAETVTGFVDENQPWFAW